MTRATIPSGLNLGLSVLQMGVSLALLVSASQAGVTSFWGILSVIAFTFVMQTGFSLIHEAEHDKLHARKAVNDVLGIFLSALFPGSFQFMKVAHLSHHRKNRSDAELVDYVNPGESRSWKTLQYYGLILGLIWVGVPLLSVAIALVPSAVLRWNRAEQGGVKMYLEFLRDARPSRVRLELLIVGLFWWGVFTVLPLTWRAIVVSYGAFAFSWASQQYVYHVRTPRHLVEGAFNLKMPRALELLYMNFNYHLTHHRDVTVPWNQLPGLSEQPTRGYLTTYLRLWLPPEPVTKAFPVEFQAKGPLPSQHQQS